MDKGRKYMIISVYGIKRHLVLISIFFLSLFNNPIQSQTTLIIESLPNTTPQNDSIFVCGTFNNWNVHDVNCQLHKQMNGKYAVTLPQELGTFEYKFTRGSWTKVETNKKNEYIPNRIQNITKPITIHIFIENWQDLGGVKQFNYFVFPLFAMALLGLVFIFLAVKIEKHDNRKILALIITSTLIIIALLGAFFNEQSNLIWQTYLSMSGHFFLFLWGPVLYLQFKILYNIPINLKNILTFLGPLFVLSIHILQLLNFQGLVFYTHNINSSITFGDATIILSGIFYSLIFHIQSYIQFIKKDTLFKTFHYFFKISVMALIVLLVNELLLITGFSWNLLQNYTLTFMILSSIFPLGLYVIYKNPEILKTRITPTNNWSVDIIKKIENLMELKKPYKNPELNILELSLQIDIKPHVLSKILNEYYKKNFRDFINEYRVKEFIRLLSDSRFQNYTFLALAYEVGFNSKSTFNLAFKKTTQLSPRDYLNLKKSNLIKVKPTS